MNARDRNGRRRSRPRIFYGWWLVGLAFLANNWVALGAALLQLILALLVGWMEDQELVARDGAAHREYIKNTGALLPRKDVAGFFRMLFVDLVAPGPVTSR